MLYLALVDLRIYLSNGTAFGSSSAQVNLATPNPDLLGVYAGTENGKLSLVIVNKSPDTPVSFDLANVPVGSYFLRHFGGEAGVAKWQASHRFSPVFFDTDLSLNLSRRR